MSDEPSVTESAPAGDSVLGDWQAECVPSKERLLKRKEQQKTLAWVLAIAPGG